MFPYNEEEWLFLSAKQTLKGEIKWLKNLSQLLKAFLKNITLRNLGWL
jgi:hypothetical protein